MARWKRLQKQADGLAESDPSRACELYTQALAEAREDDRSPLLDARADAYDRAGQADAANADRTQVIALLDAELAANATTSQAPTVPARPREYELFDMQLRRMGNRAATHQKMGMEAEAQRDLTNAIAHVDFQIQHCKDGGRAELLFGRRAALLKLLGDPVEADRALLLALDVLDIASSGPSVLTGGSPSMTTANADVVGMALAPFYTAHFGGTISKYVTDFRAAAYGRRPATLNAGRYEARNQRKALMESGRAVAVGTCHKCQDVVLATAGYPHRCPQKHKQIAPILFVVPQDVERAWGQLAPRVPAKWGHAATPLTVTTPADPTSTTTPAPPPIAAPPNTAADWYPDPSTRHQYRYWDGANWTDQVADNGVVTQDPL